MASKCPLMCRAIRSASFKTKFCRDEYCARVFCRFGRLVGKVCVAFCRFWSGVAGVRARWNQVGSGVGGRRGGVTTSAF